MPPSIQIRMLTEQETAERTRSETFNVLHPVRCTQCGNTQPFERTMFWIGGVPKAEHNDDSMQGLIAHHLRQRISSMPWRRAAQRAARDSAG